MKDQLEFCLQEGKPILIEGVGDEINPLLDPILERQVIRKGKKNYLNFSDQLVEINLDFTLYMTTKLANPHFSPELSAKCTVIDFTVTQEGKRKKKEKKKSKRKKSMLRSRRRFCGREARQRWCKGRVSVLWALLKGKR